jgi:hypothetical protein
VRELVTGARDPKTGRAFLDQLIPQVVASLPEEYAFEANLGFHQFYLTFGFLDRYFEIIFSFDPRASEWSDAENLIFVGTIFRTSGFTAHPRYLELAEVFGLFDLWEQRGPPDFCEKVSGQWRCE